MLRKICNTLTALIILCALALVAVLGIPILTGHQLYAVLTGSMEPTYPVGSIVIIKEVDPLEVAVGDVITYEASGFSTLVTHRVQSIDTEQQLLYTKGDNNTAADFYPVSFSSVRGRVNYCIPVLGRVVSGIRTPGGILVLLWILLLIVALLMLPDIVDKIRQVKDEEQNDSTPAGKQGKIKTAGRRVAGAVPATSGGGGGGEVYRAANVPPGLPAEQVVYRKGKEGRYR